MVNLILENQQTISDNRIAKVKLNVGPHILQGIKQLPFIFKEIVLRAKIILLFRAVFLQKKNTFETQTNYNVYDILVTTVRMIIRYHRYNKQIIIDCHYP